MKRNKVIVIILVMLGLALVGASIALAQGGPGDRRPPPCGEGRRGDGQNNNGRRDGSRCRDGQRGQGQNEQDVSNEPEQTAAEEQVEEIEEAFGLTEPNVMLGGALTVFDSSEEAFTNHLPGFTEAEIARFEEADELFEQAFVTALDPNNNLLDDGLGPIFNATSCERCHLEDGRGRPPEFTGETETGFLIRLAREERDLHGGTLPDAIYGGQLQDMSVAGLSSEGLVVISYAEMPGTFADGTPYSLRMPTYTITNMPYGDLQADVTFSPRVANQMIGLGLLEAIPESTLLSYTDPNDANGDGVSGRPNYVWDYYNNRLAIGRFGWKSNQPHLIQQTAGAFNGDMGISTSLFNSQPCMEVQTACYIMPAGGSPEISDEFLQQVVFYSSTLAVPAQRSTHSEQVRQGESVFVAAQCNACHVMEVNTGIHPTIPQLSNQTIRPFTDLLLHDMGEGLADGQSDYQATGSEWRTPPLWGIGLFETVNGHTYYLHDGRARNLTEAILWHGGEAAASRDYFINLSEEAREALLAFLNSL